MQQTMMEFLLQFDVFGTESEGIEYIDFKEYQAISIKFLQKMSGVKS